MVYNEAYGKGTETTITGGKEKRAGKNAKKAIGLKKKYGFPVF